MSCVWPSFGKPISPNPDLSIEDVESLLRIARPSDIQYLPTPNAPTLEENNSPYNFVPDFLYAVLLSHHSRPERLHRLLNQDFVRTLDLWTDARKELADIDDDEEKTNAASRYVQRFFRICLENEPAALKSDSQRTKELKDMHGRVFGRGLMHGRNDCCIDSLLQLMMFYKLVPDIKGKARDKACERCRHFLVEHPDPQKRPRMREKGGSVDTKATDEDHRQAFLQLDLHGEAIVRFFLRDLNSPQALEPRGVRLVEYVRWESATLGPSKVEFGRVDGADLEPLVMETYCYTGDGFHGYHYDPVFPRGVAATQSTAQNEGASTGTNTSGDASVRYSVGCSSGSSPSISAAKQDSNPADCMDTSGPTSKRELENSLGTTSLEEVPPPPDPLPMPKRPRRRIRQKTSQEHVSDGSPQEPQPGHYKLGCLPQSQSPDPRVRLEDALRRLSEELRRHPTIPADPENPMEPLDAALREDAAIQLPFKHCAFKGCAWEGETDEALHAHLCHNHLQSLGAVTKLLPGCHTDKEKRMAAYNEGIATVVRRDAPLASYAIDRRCLYKYTEATSEEALESLVCFTCARRFPYVAQPAGTTKKIGWKHALEIKSNKERAFGTFLGMSRCDTERTIGLTKFLDDYGNCEGEGPDLKKHMEDFDDWQTRILFPDGPVDVLCCPEDRKCSDEACLQKQQCCSKCRVPVCTECMGEPCVIYHRTVLND